MLLTNHTMLRWTLTSSIDAAHRANRVPNLTAPFTRGLRQLRPKRPRPTGLLKGLWSSEHGLEKVKHGGDMTTTENHLDVTLPLSGLPARRRQDSVEPHTSALTCARGTNSEAVFVRFRIRENSNSNCVTARQVNAALGETAKSAASLRRARRMRRVTRFLGPKPWFWAR